MEEKGSVRPAGFRSLSASRPRGPGGPLLDRKTPSTWAAERLTF